MKELYFLRQMLRKFITSTLALQEIAKGSLVFQPEERTLTVKRKMTESVILKLSTKKSSSPELA